MKYIDGKKSNTAIGVNIATEFNEFKDTLFNKKIMRHKMRRIQAKKHKVGTYKIDKISLTCFDDKRFILKDGFHTLTYFHKGLRKKEKKVLIKNKRFTRIKKIQKDFNKKKRISQTVTNKNKCV